MMEGPIEQKSPSIRREREVELVPLLVKANKEKFSGRDIQINKDLFKLGRGSGNNGIILDVSISRNHCVIHKNNDDLTIIDTSSSGTFLNGTKLIRNVTYPLMLDDELSFGDTRQFIYTLRMCPKDDNPEVKKSRMEAGLMELVSARQKIFEERQEAQMKEMEDKILLKQKQTEELTSRLDDMRKENELVQGESEEKNNQIKILEEQIKASKDNQGQLENNLKQLVDSMTEERRQFETKLVVERQKWQEALDMTKQEKEVFEKSMAEQMSKWKEQQLAAVATEKETLQKKLEETEKALKEQAAVAEQFRNQSALLSEMTANKDCYVYKVGSGKGGTKLQVLETIDLTEASGPSTSKANAEVGSKIMSAMDEQFTCSICQELFVKATTLNCTHTFCSHCINSWMKKQRYCPICRSLIGSLNRALVLDNFIEDAVSNLPEADQAKRRELLNERRDVEALAEPLVVRGGGARRGPPGRSPQVRVTAPAQTNQPRPPPPNRPRAPVPHDNPGATPPNPSRPPPPFQPRPLAPPNQRRPLAPQNQARPPAAQTQPRPPAPQNRARPPAPQNQARPPAPQNQARPPVPQNQARSLTPQNQARPPVPQNQARPPAPQNQARPPAPQNQARPPAPQNQARPPAPQNQARPPAPQNQARPPAPNQPLQIRVPLSNHASAEQIRTAVRNAVQRLGLPIQNTIDLPRAIQRVVQQLRMPGVHQLHRTQPPRGPAPQQPQRRIFGKIALTAHHYLSYLRIT